MNVRWKRNMLDSRIRSISSGVGNADAVVVGQVFVPRIMHVKIVVVAVAVAVQDDLLTLIFGFDCLDTVHGDGGDDDGRRMLRA